MKFTHRAMRVCLIIITACSAATPLLAFAAATNTAPFSQNLQLWDSGTAASALQQFLNGHGYLVAASGPGSPGHETSTFGTRTLQSLKHFQADRGVPATGFFGPLTRAATNALLSSNASAPALGTPSITPTPLFLASSTQATATTSAQYIPGVTPLPGYAPGQIIFGGGSAPAPVPIPDTTPPSVSLTSPSGGTTVSGSTVTLAATASDNVAIASVQFKIDNANIGSSLTSSPFTTTWNSAAVADGSHTIAAVAHDAAGNTATSSVSLTVDNTAPTISSVATSSLATTSVVISWSTNEAGSSQVEYGTSVSYGTLTLLNAAPVTSHSVAVPGLTPNTTYHYRVRTTDAAGNLATSTDRTFITMYEGFVATRGAVPSALLTNNFYLNARSTHFARDDISQLKIAIPNWYVLPGTGDQGTGGSSSFTASVEYPAGTFSQLTFGGIATGTVADGGTLWSDYVPVTIPNGAKFFIRIWGHMAGIPYGATPDHVIGDAAEISATTLNDKTLAGTIGTSFATIWFSPLGIVAPTAKPSVVIYGDSIAFGYQEGNPNTNSTGDLGVVARSVGPYFGYANLAVSGDTAVNFVSNSAKRRGLLPYASHMVNELGLNDLGGGATAAQVLSRQQSIYSFATALGVSSLQTTLTPETSSTDNYVSLANETTSVINPAKITINTAIRTGVAQLRGYLEVADALETARDSGLWKVDGATACPLLNIACDGVHPTATGSILVQTAIQPVIQSLIYR